MTKRNIIIGSVVLLAAIIGAYLYFFRHSTTYQFVTVTRGSITESVSLTGNTVPSQSVSLAFNNSGIISHTYSDLGKQVHAGEVLAELNTSDLVAQLHQAQADVDAQQAKLDSLIAGTRPEQLSIDQTAVTQANAALTSSIQAAYSNADDALHTKADQVFTNPRNSSAQLALVVPDSTLVNRVQTERVALEQTFAAWNTALAERPIDAESLAILSEADLMSVTAFLNDLATALAEVQTSSSMSAATVSGYQTTVDTGRLNVSNALSALVSAETGYKSATGALALAQAGATQNDINAQQAQVEQSQAAVQSAEAKLQNSQIIAPISGTVTQFDAKVGQLASPNIPLVSIMSSAGYEVDAGVSETDIGKISLGDKVTMTLDAFPNETWTGAVFYIAPSETNTQGVISYQIKISFDKPDTRLKSGLTANITIRTKQDDNVLILPQYAILQNDSGTFVKTLVDKMTTTTPVTLGIQDQQGNVEILSGVSQGEQVINIGLKQ